MCGIVAYVGAETCTPILLRGLKRLEYRGYDSAGVSVQGEQGLQIVRSVGKLVHLERALEERAPAGCVGMGHTRWATHGRPSEVNAHPHVSGQVAVIHNGIIENHLALRARLLALGRQIVSETDTELLAHLVDMEMTAGCRLEDATRRALAQVRGAYAVCVMSSRELNRVVAAKSGSPLVIGICSDGAVMAASDVPALLPFTRDVIIMEDDELCVLERGRVQHSTLAGQPVNRPSRRVDWSASAAEKNGYRHFMLKEIHEQPRALRDTLRGRIDVERGEVHESAFGLAADELRAVKRVYLVACGTSHHAALAGRLYLEGLARVPALTELASEFRAREPVLEPGDLLVAISQSGETSDTLAALRVAKQRGAKVLSVSNVLGSAIPRESDAVFYTHAGPEIGVASTKCFSTQLCAMLLLSVALGRARGTLTPKSAASLLADLTRIPELVGAELVRLTEPVREAARRLAPARDVLFLGRGLSYAMALEGALKLKELSYMHAEGYAAGEMKHGPIALLDASVPVVGILPNDECHAKTMSNLEEARAREAPILAIASESAPPPAGLARDVLCVTGVRSELTPFLTMLPLQLLAYEVALLRGTDVDQPRNLAKTVTVE